MSGPHRLPRSGDWWPGGMGHPNRVGAVPGWRYALFARPRRLALEHCGEVLLLDTLDHDLGEPLAAPGDGAAPRFASPGGPVDTATLPLVDRVPAPLP